MLALLQALTMAAGFFLPWTMCGFVKFHKEGKEKARTLAVIGFVICCAVIGVTVWLTFAAQPTPQI